MVAQKRLKHVNTHFTNLIIMNKFLFFCTAVVASIAISSCSNNSEIEYLPFKSHSEGKWGLIDAKGNVLFQEEFAEAPTAAVNGRFLVENKKGYWELFSAEEKPKKIGQDYSNILSFTSNVTPAVVKGGKIQIIDTDGKNVATLDKADGKNISYCSNFINGYAVIITEDNLFGIINNKGKVVVSPKYDKAIVRDWGIICGEPQSEKDKQTDSGKVIFFNYNGEEITSLRIGKKEKYCNLNIDAINSEFIPVAVLTDDGEEAWGVIDYEKNQIVKPSSKITRMGMIKNKKFPYRSDEGLWGVKDLDGNIIIRAKYEFMEWVSNDRLMVSYSNDKYSLIDLEDNELTKETYSDYISFGEKQNIAVKLDKNSWGIIDMNGQEIKIDKNVDIYKIKYELRTGFVKSEFVDTGAIVTKLNISNDGIGKFNLNMLPEAAVKVDTELSTDPSSWTYRNDVNYTIHPIEGVKIEFHAIYKQYLVESTYDSYNYTYQHNWITDKPAMIAANISGDKLQGKDKEIYDAIAKKVKSYGSVMKESDNTVVVKISETKGWIASYTGGEVIIMIVNDEKFQTIADTVFEEANSSSSASDTPADSWSVADTDSACDYTYADSIRDYYQ